jgi:serine phosphatase RsbU (regulator of sigma subunit)
VSLDGEVERWLESGAPVGSGLAARWFQALYEAPLMFSGILDGSGAVLDANQLSIEGCGLDRAETIGTPFWECGWWNPDPALAARVRSWCEQALASGDQFRVTSEYHLGDGTRRVLDLALYPLVEDTDGDTAAYLVATGFDITEVVEAQAAEVEVLRRAQDLFRSALDAMLDNVAIGRAVRDADGAIVDYELSFVNRSSVEGGDRSPDDFVGVRLSALFPAWSQSEIWRRFHDVVETGIPFVGERMPYRVVARDGTLRSGYWDLRIGKIGDGYISASRDVTAVVQAEAGLREAERTAARERAAVELLQRSALPDQLPVSDRFEVGAHYQAAEEHAIGGDWYDAFLLDDAHLVLVIADVAGHGAEAAAHMVQIRNVLRTVAVDHRQPDEILRLVNRTELVLLGEDVPMTTCCVAVLDLDRLRLMYSLAGHFAPLARTRGGERALPAVAPGLPLGVRADSVYATAEVALEPGDRLVMYTDGLIERRGESLDEGILRLGRLVDGCRHLGPQECSEHLAVELSARDDDVALMVVELRS